jgi:hypothetical protein
MIWLGTDGFLARALGVENAEHLSPLEQTIVQELNLARSKPDEYASFVRELRQYYDGKLLRKPGEIPLVTQE